MNEPTAQYTLFPTSLGACGIVWRGDMVVATRLPDAHPAETGRRLGARHGVVDGAPPPPVQRAIAAMTALLEGERADLGFIECDLADVPSFASRVYALARAIPAGETRTYGAIAEDLGDVVHSRRVGQALGRNPLPIIVPCHRVIGSNGKLTGFSATGGIHTKLRMLAIEGASLGEAPGLFGNLPLATAPPK